MNIAISFIILSLLYIICLSILYFKKSHLKNKETKLFSIMIVINFIGLVLELLCFFTVKADMIIISNVLNRLYLVYLLGFMCLFNIYTLLIIYKIKVRDVKKIDSFYKIILRTSLIIYGIASLIAISFPITFVKNTYIYSYGIGINVIYVVAAITTTIWFVLSLINIKRIFTKKYVPIVVFIVLSIITTLIQQINPGLTLTTVMESFVLFLMFHTIENPDAQIIKLLIQNRELVEESVNEKSNFLFKVSEELKKPLQNIMKEIRVYKNSSDKTAKNEIVDYIESDARNAYFIINHITNISSMDVRKLNIKAIKYNTKKTFQDIEMNVKNQLSLTKKADKIDFTFKVNNSCPETLYGDNIKIRQILLSIINNSIKHTEKGFIDVEIESIIRYDACRLIFTIKDSGDGMSIKKINELLSKNEDISEEEFNRIDGLDLKIPVIIKILKILGGSINIKSKEENGTTIVVVLNQIVDYDSTGLVLKNIDQYDLGAKTRSKVIIADDSNNIEKLKKITSKLDIDSTTTLVGKDIIDRVNSGEKFDLIILRDEMKPDSAYSILQELKNNEKFKTPVLLIIDKDKEFIKNHFIEDGFNDCIISDYIDQDLNKTIEKYL